MNLYNQALSTYKAIHGSEPEHLPYKDASHTPFRGIDPELVKELIDEKEVNKFLREWKKENSPKEVDFTQPLDDFVPTKCRRKPIIVCLPESKTFSDIYRRGINLIKYHEEVSHPDYKWDRNSLTSWTSFEKVSSLKTRTYEPSEKDLIEQYLYPKKDVMETFKRDYFSWKIISKPTLFYKGMPIVKMEYPTLLRNDPYENGIVKVWKAEYDSTMCLIGEISTDANSI